MANAIPKRTRPLSPNIQIYRPQLTSVLSIANRVAGVVLSLYAVVLVVWLVAAADGPYAYATVHVVIQSWVGEILLFGCTFSFFLHLCGGIRHLIWDAGYGFELRTIYASGWTVVVVSTALTVITWITSSVLAR
jgi:succinate dehydrogenase / fumarate reductase cytochrome b subunit